MNADEGVVMPFGRHRGERIADLPTDYLCWLMTAEIRSARLRDAIEAAHAQGCDRDHDEDASQ